MIEATSPTTWQDDVTVEYNEFAGTEFPVYAVLHRKVPNELGNPAEGCATVGLLEQFSGQVLNEMVAGGV